MINLQHPRLPRHLSDRLDWSLKAYYLEDPGEFVRRWQKKLVAEREDEEKELKNIIGKKEKEEDGELV